jgi:hypothetical protein
MTSSGQPVADRLHPSDVLDCGEAVVRCGEGDPGLGGLALGVLMAVDTQPGGVGKIGIELEGYAKPDYCQLGPLF